MELAGCKPFCTVRLSFLLLHELRYKHLQTLVSVPSAEAMLLAMLRALSRDTAWLAIEQCLPCVLYLEMRFLLQGLVLCKALKCMLKCSSAPSQECWFASILGVTEGSSVQPTFSRKNPRTQRGLGEETGLFTTHVTLSAMSWHSVMQSCSHGQYWPQGRCQRGLGTQGFSSA